MLLSVNIFSPNVSLNQLLRPLCGIAITAAAGQVQYQPPVMGHMLPALARKFRPVIKGYTACSPRPAAFSAQR